MDDMFKEFIDADSRNHKDDRKPLEPEYIVVGKSSISDKSVYYHGNSELEAHRHYKRAKNQGKGKANIYWAYVHTCKIYDVTMIERYEILEVIK